MTQILDLPILTKKKGQKPKSTKQPTLSPEELANRYAIAKARAAANREKTKERGKLSDEEQKQLRKQTQAAKAAQKAADYDLRWEVSHAARMEYCRYGGLVCLILTPNRLDPTIGAAACQQYAMLAVMHRSLLQKSLAETQWTTAEEVSRSFIGETALYDSRSSLLPTTSYELPNIPEALQDLYDTSKDILGDSKLRYLQLALALWESSVLSHDEFDQICRLRGNASLGKYEAELRSEFSCIAHELYIEEISRLANPGLSLQMYERTTSKYHMDDQQKYPVICPSVFATFYLNQTLAHTHDLIIAIGMTRVGIRLHSASTEPQSYALGFTDIYYYRRSITGFKMLESPSLSDLSRPCLFFDCTGTSFTSSPNNGIYSLDVSISRAAFRNLDPTWLLMAWAAGHPDRAKRAVSSAAPISEVVYDIYGPVSSLHFDEQRLERLDTSLPLVEQATPAEVLHYGLAHATAMGQTGDCYFNDITVRKDEAVPRTTKEMRFHVVHVRASVGELEERQRWTLRERHRRFATEACKNNALPSFGGFVFTNGKRGYSCRRREESVRFQSSGRRMEKFQEMYPEMRVFCDDGESDAMGCQGERSRRQRCCWGGHC
jgi:hypothetical protein